MTRHAWVAPLVMAGCLSAVAQEPVAQEPVTQEPAVPLSRAFGVLFDPSSGSEVPD